jgi:prepilin-type N-terminal cleavage/methylation domain-containing protein
MLATMGQSNGARRRVNARGFALPEVLLVLAIIAVVVGIALMQTAAAQRAVRLADAGHELAGYLEGARADSIRRRATTPATMAGVSIDDDGRYEVTADFDRDGTLETRVIQLPTGVSFNFTLPVTVSFDWRGRVSVTPPPSTASGGTTLSMTNGSGSTVSTHVTGIGDVMPAIQASSVPGNVNLETHDGQITHTTHLNTRTVIP